MSRPGRQVALVIALQAVLFASSALAQWPSSPATNLAIADRTADQVQPYIRATSDGGCYISWFDNATGGYDVRLQRLNAAGVEQWAHNGILIADRSYGWTTDYGMTVDTADNAIITYNDDRVGGDQIGCNKVSPDGTLLWGPTGVRLTNTADFVASPKVTVTTDGAYVVGCLHGDGYFLQKLDGTGTPLWGSGIYAAPTTGFNEFSDLKAAENGSVIVMWVYFPNNYTKNLYAQKYSSAGAPLWGASPKIIYDGGGLQYGYFPNFEYDGAGGLVVAWYDTGGVRNAYVQHINGAGQEVFAHNGVAVSTLTNDRIRLEPSLAYNPATQETFVSWTESNSLQSRWGLYAQRLSPTGARLWSASGRELLSLTVFQNSFLRTTVCGSGAIFFYSDKPGTTQLRAFRLDSAGNLVWSGSPRAVSTATPGEKYDTNIAKTPGGAFLLAWTDTRSDSGNIFAQKINADGMLGNEAFGLGDLNCSGALGMDDIDPFVLALSGQAAFQAQYPQCSWLLADLNHDGQVDFADIDAFVAMLIAG